MTHEEEIIRGKRAQTLLSDPLMTEGFDALRTFYLGQIEGTPPDRSDAREHIYHHLLALKEVRGHLETMIASGKLAAEQVARLNRRPGGGRP